jgi:hypothetical protein
VARLHSPATSRARIPISGFRGPVLLLAGSDDQQWPSPIFSTQIMRELRRDPAVHQRRVYAGAGHVVLDLPSVPASTLDEPGGVGIELGGTPAANDAAHRADWPLALRFIAGH